MSFTRHAQPAASAAVAAARREVPVGTVVDDAASVEFHAFFERHYAELSRLAHLLTGEADAADDLAADALLALWHRWDRVRAADHPVAYARGVVANLARTRIRSAVRERRRITLFWSQREEKTDNPDVPGVVDVQSALRRLPFRKRACVVLRHAFDLSEKDTALALGVSVGTVKSQTSKGMAELQKLLGTEDAPRRMHAGITGGGVRGASVTGAAAPGSGGRDR
ncbi:ECF RNA polymerase sigma factor SigM [Streptomyces scabiei]|uniref:ECF RNA polymerase sigma factor SigM n=1 Tax=Streptomyces scabiei TaxID=1930 RepID=A0A117ECU6_STRSC|nr:ECF RNA polymerase sigma factor SigM [Streptomyces scabiei]